jgi:hypothetical protein
MVRMTLLSLAEATRSRFGRTCFGMALLLGLVACAEETPQPVPATAGTFLLDHQWAYRTTQLVPNTDEALPFPTDPRVQGRLSYPAGDAPPTGDALYGSLLNFGADGRVLMQPPGFTEFHDWGSRYSIVDGRVVRLKLGTSSWFPYEYHYGSASGTLLLNPEAEASEAVVKLVNDLLTKVLVAGELESAASKLADALFGDARVAAAVAQQLPAIETLADSDPQAAGRWLFELLAPSEIFEPGLGQAETVEGLVPVMEDLFPVEPAAFDEGLIDGVLDAGVTDPALADERIERVIRFALYRHVLETRQNLRTLEHVEIELERAR